MFALLHFFFSSLFHFIYSFYLTFFSLSSSLSLCETYNSSTLMDHLVFIRFKCVLIYISHTCIYSLHEITMNERFSLKISMIVSIYWEKNNKTRNISIVFRYSVLDFTFEIFFLNIQRIRLNSNKWTSDIYWILGVCVWPPFIE